METGLAVQQPAEVPMELSVTDVLAQVQKIQQVMKLAMKAGEHYGVIPGTNKPTLLKAGAEKLNLLFRFDPQYESAETYDGDHLTVKSKCILYHMVSGMRVGSGEGSCSTKETKYAYRNAGLICPKCGKETVIKGKVEFGGGFLCWEKKGGCGAKFTDDDFKGVQGGKIANDNLPDQYNTVLKMANKRSLIAAVLNATAASDIFTQDLEDMVDNGAKFGGGEQKQEAKQAGSQQQQKRGNGTSAAKKFERSKAHEELARAIEEYTAGDRDYGLAVLEEITTWTDAQNKIHPGVRDVLEISEKSAIVAKRILERDAGKLKADKAGGEEQQRF